MNLVNLTRCVVTLIHPHTHAITTVYPSGTIARVLPEPRAPHVVEGLPVPVFGPPLTGRAEGIPEPVEGTAYIVSRAVLAATSRPDVYALGTESDEMPLRRHSGRSYAATHLVAARPMVTGGVLVGNV